MNLWDLLEDHGQARRDDPHTSHAAAHAVHPGSARYRLLVAHYDHPDGLTDEEACDLANLSQRSEYATRCSELSRSGFIEDTVATRRGESGLARIVRRITPIGRTRVELEP